MIRFFTLDKKPKIWNIAFLSVLLISVLFLLSKTGKLSFPLMTALISSYLLLCIFILVRACLLQLRYNPYSYNVIYYIGFSILLFIILLQVWMTVIRFTKDPGYEDSVKTATLLGMLASSGTGSMLYLFPFAFAYSLGLCFSNLILIRKEGRSLVNLLGVIMFLLLSGGLFFMIYVDWYASGSVYEVMFHDILVNIFAAVYVYCECMLLGTMAANLIVTEYQPDKDTDFLIILGCGLKKDGTPTPLLAGRIERALSFYQEQLKETGKKATFITSGGQGKDEVISESQSMRNYLLSKGIGDEEILMEDRSTNTFENMTYSKKIIDSFKEGKKVLFSTTNYHVFRSGLMARRAGMKAIGLGAETKWYFWPNASIREFAGLLKEHRLKQCLILLGMILIYTALTALSYLY
ncbi:MAG: YdcF family protein [Erysipelotrichaceae bacterium]|nr:YdcF family protein [Erysipelotrichaceae bacterium]